MGVEDEKNNKEIHHGSSIYVVHEGTNVKPQYHCGHFRITYWFCELLLMYSKYFQGVIQYTVDGLLNIR